MRRGDLIMDLHILHFSGNQNGDQIHYLEGPFVHHKHELLFFLSRYELIYMSADCL